MAETRAYSANFHHVQAIAQRALDNPSGLIVAWTLRDQPTLDACKLKARSFQQSFTSFRARDRRLSAKLLGESSTVIPRDSFASSKYDRLVCAREMTPAGDGWQIRFIHVGDMLSELNIIDPSTGLPLADMGAGQDEENRLIEKLAGAWGKGAPPMPDGELNRLLALSPDDHTRGAVAAYRAHRDGGEARVSNTHTHLATSTRDIADLSEEELGFALPEEGEKETP